jgi:Putative serine esterase (DUF676)
MIFRFLRNPLALPAAVLMLSSMMKALNLSTGDSSQSAATTNDLPQQRSSPSPGTCSSASINDAHTAHLVVLVHGWMGNPLELGYLQQAMTAQAPGLVSEGNALVVRSSEVNDGRTSDGIKAGGERLATEVSSWVDELFASPKVEKVSLSFVGNSLGGLYARYAIGVPALDLDRVEPKLFCTTATPHLGVSEHTYVSLPRFVERWVAAAIQSTGRDLFRVTDTMERMTVDSPFVTGLRRFRKRVAYANAHYTDFQVPSATAAFVVPDLESPHVRLDSPRPDFVAIAVETPATDEVPRSTNDPSSAKSSMSSSEMARRLDAFGWTKVFVDLRPHLASIPLPFARDTTLEPEDRGRYSSSELHERYCRVTNRLHFPLGHTVLVANSKNSFYSKINAAGKPVVDRLAADLLREILD